MTISDLQLIMNVTMWTGEPGDTHRSEVVFAQVLHGAQASIAIPSSEDGLAQVEGDLGYKWSVPNGNRLLELAGLGEPTARLSSGHNQIDGWSDRRVQLKQLEGLAMESHDYFVMRPPGQLPTWAVNQAQYAETRVGKRTWVLSLSAFRPSDQKTVQLMSEVALNLNYGNPDDSMVRFLSWEHTAIKSLTASHERPPHDGEGHLHGHLRPPATADGTWEFHLHLTTMEGGIPWACCEAEELTEALKHVPWV